MQSTVFSKSMNFLMRLRTALVARLQNRGSFWGAAWGRLTDWLAVVTWKRLFVVFILMLIAGGLFTAAIEEMFYGGQSVVTVTTPDKADKKPSDKKTKIIISADEKGVRVQTVPAGEPVPPAPPAPPSPPPAPGMPSVSINNDGIVVSPDGSGGKSDVPLVSITKDGISVKPGSDEAKAARNAAAQARAEAEQARADAEIARKDAQEARSNAEVIAQNKGVQVIVDAKKDLPEDVQELLDEIKTSIEDSQSEEESETKTIVSKVKPSAPAIFMNLIALMIFGMITLKVIMNTQRKAQAKVAVAEEATERETLKRQLTEARLTTMQAQVEPHFLFNTLASVDHLIEVAPKRASQMQKSLIQYLRAAMPHMRETTSNMGREAQLVTSYLEILKFRMEERLEFAVDVSPGLASAEIPPMMLLSLVENAIKHGLEPKPEGGRIDVKAEIAHGKLRVTVADTGLGYTPNNSPTRGTGVGLANINERLAMLYPGQAQLAVTANKPQGTLCTIELPYRVSQKPMV
ncbi:MAG: sensor histidine kinase [Burkholderiaceae bacterium]